jgi:hypothetical protein
VEGTLVTYLEPTQEAGRAFFMRQISGSVVMLNLLRFRQIADYSATPALAPPGPITGAAAYRLYMEHTLPHLEKSGGQVLFLVKAAISSSAPRTKGGTWRCSCAKVALALSWRSHRTPNTWPAWDIAWQLWRIPGCSPWWRGKTWEVNWIDRHPGVSFGRKA